jgi:hypothetical protein
MHLKVLRLIVFFSSSSPSCKINVLYFIECLFSYDVEVQLLRQRFESHPGGLRNLQIGPSCLISISISISIYANSFLESCRLMRTSKPTNRAIHFFGHVSRREDRRMKIGEK